MDRNNWSPCLQSTNTGFISVKCDKCNIYTRVILCKGDVRWGTVYTLFSQLENSSYFKRPHRKYALFYLWTCRSSELKCMLGQSHGGMFWSGSYCKYLAVEMQRPVSSLSLNPSVKVRLVGAGFQFTTDLLHVNPLQLSKGNVSVHLHPWNCSKTCC